MKARAHCVLSAVLVVATAASALLVGPAARPCQAQVTLQFTLTDKDIDQAMERLRNYLWMNQRDDGSWTDITGSHYKKKKGGTTALAALALLESGVKLSEPRMEKALESLMSVEMDDTYCYAVRVMAMSQAYRLAQREQFAAQIVYDLNYLTENLPKNGAWGYTGSEKNGDNSASQYGLLALWEAEWAGFDRLRTIPKDMKLTVGSQEGSKEVDISALWPAVVRNLQGTWRPIEQQWVARQRPDKGWTYAAIPTPEVQSTLTMTAAGVASLYIIVDEVYAAKMIPGKPRPATQVFQMADQGMEWLAKRLPADFTSDGYLAFGIQRIAAASGHKYIGDKDWFRLGVKEIARRAAAARTELGGEYGGDVQAAFYLLFLARGRVPVTFNKLDRGPDTDWDIAPRDIANLTRHLITTLEQRMAWQIVHQDRPVAEFLDAPILFINGMKPLAFTPETVAKMREYVLRGGTIVGEATNGSPDLAASFKKMLEQAFPEGALSGAETYVWKQMAPTHPILAAFEERDLQQEGTVWHMEDPVRTVAVLLTRDHATAWQHMDVAKKGHCFKMGLNLFRYATGQEPLRTRLRPVFAGRTLEAETKKKVGLLPAGPRWLSDIYSVERLSDKLAADARVMVLPELVQDAAQVNPKECPVIWVYGRGASKLAESQLEGLREFVRKGGLVAINANMGDKVFGLAAKGLAKQILPDALPSPILDTDTIFTGLVYRERGKPIEAGGVNLALRAAGVNKVGLTGYRTGDRWGVIVSPHDSFMTMLGAPIFGCQGYTGETAQQIAGNIFLYALEQAEKAAEGPKS